MDLGNLGIQNQQIPPLNQAIPAMGIRNPPSPPPIHLRPTNMQIPAMGFNKGVLGSGSANEAPSDFRSGLGPDSVSIPTPSANRQKSVIYDYESKRGDRENPRSRFGKVDFPVFNGNGKCENLDLSS